MIPIVTIFHHKERSWSDYLREYSCLKELEARKQITIQVKSLPQQNAHLDFAKLPERVRRLLFFAKPDVVICLDDGVRPIQPVFAIDVTEHVAARDHWIQRFPNLVGCAQEGIPGAFIAPRDMPRRKNFSGKTDPVFFFAYDRVVELHECPIYIAEWPSTDKANLDTDAKYGDLPPHTSPGIANTLEFFRLALEASLHGRELSTLVKERLIVTLRSELRSIGYKTLPKINNFERLALNMPNNRELDRKEFNEWLSKRKLKIPTDLPDRIAKRNKVLIFSPTLMRDPTKERKNLIDRIKKRGGDPYTQQPLVFDYLFCRTGPTPIERDVTLVIDLSLLQFSDFASYVQETWKNSPLQHTDFKKISHEIPIYTLHLTSGISQVIKNFVRLYAFAADIIVFQDGMIHF